MSLATLNSRANVGIHANPVTVEVHLSNGLPGFSITGLPELAVKESRHRVRSAIINSALHFPVRRITVNLAPADLPKEGARFDLPIALGILAASNQIPKTSLDSYEWLGELALSGLLRPIRDILPAAVAANQAKHQLILSKSNANEAMICSNLTLFIANHLSDICAHLLGEKTLPIYQKNIIQPLSYDHDFKSVAGQPHGRRALEIAAIGGHNLLMIGPPGAGKTMLAHCLPSILPPMNENEALSVASIYSTRSTTHDITHWKKRPFRSPHHSISLIGMVGGGNPPKPGEISLAHHGVLFLDEIAEFNRSVLEALREPLEAGNIHITRSKHQITFPACFQLIAAMNPCPCGYLGDIRENCRCTTEQVKKYRHRLSGPFLDRIDMHIEIQALSQHWLLHTNENNEPSERIAHRVIAARNIQFQRTHKTNAQLNPQEIQQHCVLTPTNKQLMEQAFNRLTLSARAYHRILKVARSIADLDEATTIKKKHLQEAMSYRLFDPGLR